MGAFNFEPLGHVRRIGARLEVRPVPLLGLDDGLAVAIGRRLFSTLHRNVSSRSDSARASDSHLAIMESQDLRERRHQIVALGGCPFPLFFE
jgi:hypothetical protein